MALIYLASWEFIHRSIDIIKLRPARKSHPPLVADARGGSGTRWILRGFSLRKVHVTVSSIARASVKRAESARWLRVDGDLWPRWWVVTFEDSSILLRAKITIRVKINVYIPVSTVIFTHNDLDLVTRNLLGVIIVSMVSYQLLVCKEESNGSMLC